MPIVYLIGDATRPTGAGLKIICHVCNDIGGWGAGFVLALSRRWRLPEQRYRGWHAGSTDDDNFELGAVQFVPVEPDVIVANMIGQHGIRREVGGTPPIRYEAIREALRRVAEFALAQGGSIHMPRIGAGLAGGDWTVIEQIIEQELCSRSISVSVYDLPRK